MSEPTSRQRQKAWEKAGYSDAACTADADTAYLHGPFDRKAFNRGRAKWIAEHPEKVSAESGKTVKDKASEFDFMVNKLEIDILKHLYQNALAEVFRLSAENDRLRTENEELRKNPHPNSTTCGCLGDVEARIERDRRIDSLILERNAISGG